MSRSYSVFPVMLCSLMWITLVCADALAADRKLSLDDIFASDQFMGATVADVMWLPDGSAFTFTRANARSGQTDIFRHEVVSGKETLVLQGDQLNHKGKQVLISAYLTTGSQDHLLITGPRKQIWRHSFAAPYYLYHIGSRTLQPLAGGNAELQNTSLSPDGKWVAYVLGTDLYVAEVPTGKAKRLTDDGTENILNGLFDWVYEEEFGRSDALRWSPDSSRIAFWKMDQTRVRFFSMIDELEPYSKIINLKYPKAGEQNARVKIGVVSVSSGDVVFQDLGSKEDIYIPRIAWTNKPGQLAIQRLNRLQNHLELLLADTASGSTRVILEDKDPAWIDVTDDFVFLAQSERFLWTSEKNGFRHIYLADDQGRQIAQLTDGPWEVRAIIGVDEQAGFVYFNAAPVATESALYRVSLAGGESERLSTPGGWHSAVFAPDMKHYVGYASSIKTPPQVRLHRADGSPVRLLEPNEIEALQDFEMLYPQLLEVTATDGTRLSAYMIKPADFDPARRYPVIVFGYGGPGSQMVIDRWGTGAQFRHLQIQLWHQYMAEQGFLVFCLDNRGTGGKGKQFKNLAYGDLSKWAVADQIEGAKYLAGLPYVDSGRIGFWGWSGGGYLTAMIMTRASDYFKVGVSVAPVSDFRNYDSIWTERYMGLPQANQAGYDAANVLRYAAGLKGRLLVVHGSGDDNVHPGNTLQMAQAFVTAGRQFDMMIYPNRNHRINSGNSKSHLFTKMAEYFQTHL